MYPDLKLGLKKKQTEFSKEETHSNAQKHLKKCSTTWVIRELQIKTILWFILQLSQCLRSKQMTTHVGEDVVRGTLINWLWEYKLIQTLYKSVWWFLKKGESIYLNIQLYHFCAHTQRMLHATVETVAQPCSLLLYS